jgi:phage terminase large subunit-like protein
VAGRKPGGPARKTIALYRRRKPRWWQVNMGGDMVRAVLQQVDASVAVKCVHATRGKWLRAEPVAAMYSQGRVKHVDPPLVALEDEMADFGLDGLSSGASPDRLDALVWAVTELTARPWQGQGSDGYGAIAGWTWRGHRFSEASSTIHRTSSSNVRPA